MKTAALIATYAILSWFVYTELRFHERRRADYVFATIIMAVGIVLGFVVLIDPYPPNPLEALERIVRSIPGMDQILEE